MNLISKIIQEMAEYNADEEFDSYTAKLADNPRIQDMSDEEYQKFLDKENVKKHYKLDYKAKKNIEKAISSLKIKDQIEVLEVIDELMKTAQLSMLRIMGDLLAEYIKEYALKGKDYDDELYIEILDSGILSKDSKKDLELMQKALITKSSRVTSKLTAQDIKLKSQQNLYELLLAEQHDILDIRMRMGRIFKKYLDESTLRRTMIDGYLLHRLIDFVYGGLAEDEF